MERFHWEICRKMTQQDVCTLKGFTKLLKQKQPEGLHVRIHIEWSSCKEDELASGDGLGRHTLSNLSSIMHGSSPQANLRRSEGRNSTKRDSSDETTDFVLGVSEEQEVSGLESNFKSLIMQSEDQNNTVVSERILTERGSFEEITDLVSGASEEREEIQHIVQVSVQDSKSDSLILQFTENEIATKNSSVPSSSSLFSDMGDDAITRARASLNINADDEIADTQSGVAVGQVNTDLPDPSIQGLGSQSLDFVVHANESESRAIHITRPVLRCMDSCNFLNLVQDSRWLKNVVAQIERDVVTNGRNGLDYVGKLVFSLLLLALGVSAKQVVVDSAQAGGVCGDADGFLVDCRKYLEIKACIAKARNDREQGPNAHPQCTIHNVRTDSLSSWGAMVSIMREKDPVDWTNLHEYDACGFRIGIALRIECMDSLRRSCELARTPIPQKQTVTVTPRVRGEPPARPRSWIGPCLEWFRVGDLLRDARERQRFKARLGIA